MIVRFPQKGHQRGNSSSGNVVTPDRGCLLLQAVRQKESTAGRKALPLPVAPKFRSGGWPSPSVKVSLERKKNTASTAGRHPSFPRFGRYKSVIRSEILRRYSNVRY